MQPTCEFPTADEDTASPSSSPTPSASYSASHRQINSPEPSDDRPRIRRSTNERDSGNGHSSMYTLITLYTSSNIYH